MHDQRITSHQYHLISRVENLDNEISCTHIDQIARFFSFLLLASLKKARTHALTPVGKRAMSASETDLYTFHMCVSTLTSSAAVSLSLEFKQ